MKNKNSIKKAIATLLIIALFATSAFVLMGCGGSDIDYIAGGNVDIGSRRQAITGSQVRSLILNWQEYDIYNLNFTLYDTQNLDKIEIIHNNSSYTNQEIMQQIEQEGCFTAFAEFSTKIQVVDGNIAMRSFSNRDGFFEKTFDYNGVRYRQLIYNNETISKKQAIENSHWPLIFTAVSILSDSIDSFRIGLDFTNVEITGYAYSRGYRISIIASCPINYRVANVTMAFCRDGRLLGVTRFSNHVTFISSDIAISFYYTTITTVIWQTPRNAFPRNFDDFLLPNPQLVVGIEVWQSRILANACWCLFNNYYCDCGDTVNTSAPCDCPVVGTFARKEFDFFSTTTTMYLGEQVSIVAIVSLEVGFNACNTWFFIEFEIGGIDVEKIHYTGSNSLRVTPQTTGELTITIRSLANKEVYITKTILVV